MPSHMPINLRHMEVFRAVYSAGGISRGAEMLGIAQPTVSRMIRHMEDRLGYPLFSLEKGRAVSTPEAARLFVEIDAVFERVDGVMHAARAIGEGSGEALSVVAISNLATSIVPYALRETQRAFPAVDLSLSVNNYRDQLQMLARGEVKIGIVGNPTTEPGLGHQWIGEGHLMAVLPLDHPIADQDGIALSAFGQWPCILPPRRSPWGHTIYQALEAAGARPRLQIVMQSPPICEELVRQFGGISIVDDLTARTIAERGKVAVRPLRERLTYQVTALWPLQHKPTRAGRLFLAFLEEELARRNGAPWGGVPPRMPVVIDSSPD